MTYEGNKNNIIKRYRAAFQVDWECAIADLIEFGVEVDEIYLKSLRETINRDVKNEKKHVPISRLECDIYHGIERDSDENFAFIAGYTSGGFPYGVTWEEMEEIKNSEHAKQPGLQ